jgi:Na+/H+ antiporter NhaD/arsenite permease-like protein
MRSLACFEKIEYYLAMEIKWVVLGIAVLMYAVVVIFPSKKAWATLAAAVLVLVLRVVGPARAFGELVNWNVLAIFMGSLVLAELFIYSRMPARIADAIVNGTPNSGVAIVILLIITGLISAFVENVATVLVMAPIALELSRKLKMNPTGFMVGLAVMANLQGTATLVGDPPSLIFASFAHYSFNDFFVFEGKPSIFFVVQIGMLAGAVYFYFRLTRGNKNKITLQSTPVLSIVPTVLLVLMIAALAASSFFSHGLSASAGISVLVIAVFGLLWYILPQKQGWKAGWKIVKGLDWETMFFLVGIFIVIGAIGDTGLLDDLAAFLNHVIGGNVALGFIVILAVSVVVSGFVDNVPYIIAMLPVAAHISQSLGLEPELYMFALLVGSCLGGNLTPFGASANIVAMGIVKKEGHSLNFGGWLKIGCPFTLFTTAAAAVFLWLVWR